MEQTDNTGRKETRLSKPNNIIMVPAKGIELFKRWCIFLRPFIPLTNKEVDVMANFLYQRYELSKTVSDPSMLDTLLMSEKIKDRVIKESKISKPHFYVIMSNLRKNKVITGNAINPRLVPNIRQSDNGVFQLLILFKEDKKSA